MEKRKNSFYKSDRTASCWSREMSFNMARLANSNAITWFIAEFRKFSPRFYVMNMKFFYCPTFQAFKIISRQDNMAQPSISNIVGSIAFPIFFKFIFGASSIRRFYFRIIKSTLSLFHPVREIFFSAITNPMRSTRTGTKPLFIDLVRIKRFSAPFAFFYFPFFGVHFSHGQ